MKTVVEAIVPCYNEESCIELFYNKMCDVFEELPDFDFVITYIDDGSKDATLDKIKEVKNSAKRGRIQYISLSRNFGKESAIYAGLSQSTGDYVVCMDVDLQHPPELLKQMIVAVEEEGYDCASARRTARKGIRNFFSKMFYHLISRVTAVDLVPGSTDYRLMKRSVVNAIVSMAEHERFTKGIYSWVGFRNKWIEYKDVERAAGKTKWSFTGLVRYAYGGFVAFATTPLRGVIYLGIIVVLLAVIYAIYIFINALKMPGNRTGYATILIVMLFLGGVIIIILGMIGEYIARIYMEVKNRPIYLAREICIERENIENLIVEKPEESSGSQQHCEPGS